jgi:hypothetical protein
MHPTHAHHSLPSTYLLTVPAYLHTAYQPPFHPPIHRCPPHQHADRGLSAREHGLLLLVALQHTHTLHSTFCLSISEQSLLFPRSQQHSPQDALLGAFQRQSLFGCALTWACCHFHRPEPLFGRQICSAFCTTSVFQKRRRWLRPIMSRLHRPAA